MKPCPHKRPMPSLPCPYTFCHATEDMGGVTADANGFYALRCRHADVGDGPEYALNWSWHRLPNTDAETLARLDGRSSGLVSL